MAMPSVTVMELNSMGVPPRGADALLDLLGQVALVDAAGVTSVQVWQTATRGLSMSASVRPVAFHMAAGAGREGPFLIVSLGTSCPSRFSRG
jgi:hypothetical protein